MSENGEKFSPRRQYVWRFSFYPPIRLSVIKFVALPAPGGRACPGSSLRSSNGLIYDDAFAFGIAFAFSSASRCLTRHDIINCCPASFGDDNEAHTWLLGVAADLKINLENFLLVRRSPFSVLRSPFAVRILCVIYILYLLFNFLFVMYFCLLQCFALRLFMLGCCCCQFCLLCCFFHTLFKKWKRAYWFCAMSACLSRAYAFKMHKNWRVATIFDFHSNRENHGVQSSSRKQSMLQSFAPDCNALACFFALLTAKFNFYCCLTLLNDFYCLFFWTRRRSLCKNLIKLLATILPGKQMHNAREPSTSLTSRTSQAISSLTSSSQPLCA